MDDLSSRSALQEVLDETDWYHISEDGKLVWGAHSEDDGLYRVRDICDALKEATAIDAVEVVRCGDCKFAEISINIIGDLNCCCNNSDVGFYEWRMGVDDFCSFGERREEK